MPTHAAGRGDGSWAAWVRAWLDVWGRVAHSGYWDRHWLALFARLAKHDTAGEAAATPGTLQVEVMVFRALAAGIKAGFR